MGLAFSLARLAAPWSSGTGGASLRGLTWVRWGRFIPFLGKKITSPIVWRRHPETYCGMFWQEECGSGWIA